MRAFLLPVLVLLLAGCGGAEPPEGHANATMQEASVTAGDVSIRASVVPTASLNRGVAARYGIDAGPGSVMLLVGVRQGPPMRETALFERRDRGVGGAPGGRDPATQFAGGLTAFGEHARRAQDGLQDQGAGGVGGQALGDGRILHCLGQQEHVGGSAA